MSINVSQSNVALGNGFDPMLHNLQANILKSHGRNFAYHLFFVFDEYKEREAKHWIRHFAASTITSAYAQLDATRRYKEYGEDGGAVYNLSLSYSGCRKLGTMPGIANSAAFDGGLRGSADLLKDKPDEWQDEFKNRIDMLIIVADDDAEDALRYADDIIQQTKHFATCVLSQRGNVLKMKDTGVGIEHFSYADGISQPMYLQEEIANQNNTVWHDETPLERVLVAEQNSTGQDCYGSYLVFRKLEQNVKCFKIAEGDADPDPAHPECKRLLPSVLLEDGSPDDEHELSGAMIVGRFEDSTPVTLHSEGAATPPSSSQMTNDFDYSDDKGGMKCPFHAHIRLVNPRNGDTKENGQDLLVHRITRRGITFDDGATKRIPDDQIVNITSGMLDDNPPEGGVGLLFMCYQANIADQFEILQALWANQGLIGGLPVKGQDSLITQGTDLPRFLPKQWGQPLHGDNFQFSGFVTMRGGEYFYTPSLPFLKHL